MGKNNVIPPVVSGRNQFQSLEVYVDEAIRDLARAELIADTPEIQACWRCALKSAFEHFLHNVRWAFAGACERGMDQVIDLMVDPAFYENGRRRAKKRREAMLAQRTQQQADRERRKVFGLSPEETKQRRAYLMGNIEWHTRELEKAKTQLAALPNVVESSRMAM